MGQSSSAAIPKSVIPTVNLLTQPWGCLLPALQGHSAHSGGNQPSKEPLMAVQVLRGKEFHRVPEKAVDKALIGTEWAEAMHILATLLPGFRGQTYLWDEHPETRVSWTFTLGPFSLL